ncbi:MAG TPA: bifunctional YncE family protein/alkaline phosphatase family protein [Gammaproteobacteria bacterium]|nr:bifunctional YncE family protein/alkaline phosphatase family protein [Gammaproteobacteria bacterium]
MNTRLPILLAAATVFMACTAAWGDADDKTRIPTGQFITPLAALGATFQPLNPHLHDFPDYTVGQAMSEALSPDGRTLLILTSGYNRLNNAEGKQAPLDSNEYVFVYDVSGAAPRQVQVIQVPDTFAGLAFAPDGQHFYVSGGQDDDVHIFEYDAGFWVEPHPPIKLGHEAGNGVQTPPVVAGIAVTADGKRLVAANYYNDSVSVVDLDSGKVTGELDLRPGKSGGATGAPGGENPFWVAIASNATAYVSSQRDREVDVVDIAGSKPKLTARIPLKGTPVKMLLDPAAAHLYVACDNSDVVAAIDTAKEQVTDAISTIAPAGVVKPSYDYRGVAPNALALSADGKRLYVTNGGTNSVAVVALDGPAPKVLGLIPTGWYPQAVVAGRLQEQLYVVNSRSNPGPNPDNPNHRGHPKESMAHNHYILQLEKAGFLTLPVPGDAALATLTQQVLANDEFNAPASAADAATMAALRKKIKHVIYIIKENRTYDQILGDLDKGNGDPKIAEFGAQNTPNFHALAGGFVDLDNFYVSGEVSSEGWPWSIAARESDQGEKTIPETYANRGVVGDTQGLNRGVNVAYPTLAERRAAWPSTPDDPDLLPGSADVAGMDGPGGAVQQGYLWSAARRAGLSVRNYGMEPDTSRYDPDDPNTLPRDRTPYADHEVVMYPAYPDLMGVSDPYYRSFDPGYPDFYREREWQREFTGFEKDGKLPALSLVWLPGDHMGDFGHALDGVNTPERQQADNDYAVGKLIQTVAASRYKQDTLIFILEDDAQDGPDHVDAHRSTAYVVGPYVKHGAVVSDYYTTVNMLRTIEDVLGLDHLSIFDANERPMTDVFDLRQADWSYTAAPSKLLAGTQLPIPGLVKSGARLKSTHDGAYWAAKTRGMDFSSEDRVDAVGFNRIVWQGLMAAPYPETRSGMDLRAGRAALLSTTESDGSP